MGNGKLLKEVDETSVRSGPEEALGDAPPQPISANSSLGIKIRSARREAGLSQKDLGARFGTVLRGRSFSQAVISDMERGAVELSPEMVAELAKVLGKHPSYFADASDLEALRDRFEGWKHAWGLNRSFPHLTELSDEELDAKFYVAPHRQQFLGLASASSQAAIGQRSLAPTLDMLGAEIVDARRNPLIREIGRRARTRLVAVLVRPGHGCTTLSRYVSKDFRKSCVERGLIPIRIALDDVRQHRQEEPMRALEVIMRREIVLI